MTHTRLKNLLLSFFFILGGSQSAFATHLIGGEMNYKCLGNNEYQISLTVYRDCYLGVAQLDDTAYVAVYDIDNELVQTLPMLLGEITSISQVDKCLLIPPNICVETTTYVDTVTLMPQVGGYHLAYQRCCRNQTILNIIDPLNTGTTYDIVLSEAAMRSCNSSPILNDWPPTFVCVNRPLSYSSAAFDIDGDSLAYRLCTPLEGGISFDNPRPRPAFPPPYDTVRWNAPNYSLDNQIGGEALEIDPKTGLLTGMPNIIGQFVVGICVDEYRDGQLISSTRRDFQYNVIPCEDVKANFDLPTSQCDNQTVELENQTLGQPDGYLWKFLNSNDDIIGTSTDTSPIFNFPDTGNYVVRLIANSNSICADSIDKSIFLLPNTLTADFGYEVIDCTDSLELQFLDESINTFGPIDNWKWTFDGEITQSESIEQSPKITLLNSQILQVTLQITTNYGCVAEKTIELDGVIIPDSLSLPTFETLITCIEDSITLNPNFDASLTYSWSPADGLSNTIVPNPRAFPDTSVAYVVTISDSGNNCELKKNVSLEVLNFDDNFDFDINFLECGDSARIQLVPIEAYNLNVVDIDWEVLIEGQSYLYDHSAPVIVFKNADSILVKGTVSDNYGCSKTVEKKLQVDFVKDSIDKEFTFCLGDTIALNSEFNPDYTYQWSPASLFFNPNSPNPVISPTSSAEVKVVINNKAKNCPIERTINLILLTPIESADFDYKLTGCDDSITLEIINVTTQPEGLINKIAWSLNGDTENSSSTDLMPTFILQNSQLVQLQMTINPDENCPTTATKSLVANILENINLNKNLDICKGESIELNPAESFPDYNYTWTPSNTLNDATSINPLASPTESTTYKVNYTDSTGLCLVEKEVSVKVRDTLPKIDAGIAINCDARTISITPTTNALITYDFGDSNTIESSIDTLTYEYANAGNYQLMLNYSDENICKDSTTIEVALPTENLTPNFEWNVEACIDNVASLELLDLSKSIFGEITSWEWQLSNGERATEAEPLFQIGTNDVLTTQLVITLDNDAQCKDSITMDIPPLIIEEDFLDSIVVCSTSTIDLNPEYNAEYTYLWSPVEVIENINQPNPTITIDQAQTFIVQVSNDYECVLTDSIFTQVAPFININTLEIPTVCESSEIVLMAESEQTSQLAWIDSTGDTLGTEPELLVDISESQTFTAVFTDGYNCQNEANVFVDFQPILLDFDTEQPVCENENKILLVNNLRPESSLKFDWMPTFEIIEGGETNSPTVSLEEPTTFIFEVGNEAGCKASGEIFVDILPLPEIEATADPQTIFVGDFSELSATNAINYIYNWTPENTLDNPTIANPLANPLTSTTYTVNVMDENGCVNSADVNINVREGVCDFPYIFVPSGFTPNNDGENDVLFVRGVFIDELTFIIYDRWGDKVFETENQKIGWDGTKNGVALPSGVFGYYLRAVCKNGEVYSIQGNVTLIR